MTGQTSKIVQLGEKQAVLLLALEEGASLMPQKTIGLNRKVRNVHLLGGFIPPRDCI
jgi:hypothetical protein